MRKLSWLARWIERCEAHKDNYTYVSLMDAQRRGGTRFDQEHSSFFEPNIDNPYYLAFECQRAAGINQDRLNRMHVVTHNRALRSRTSELRRWPKLDWDQSPGRKNGRSPENVHHLDTRAAHMVSLITVALRRILRWQKECLGFEHRLVWSDFRDLRPEGVREGEPPCVLCMAFSLWCLLINSKFTNYFVGTANEGAHELLRFANYRQVPNIPMGIFIDEHQGAKWRPSINFERWLFLRASERAFAEFVSLANWIFVKTADKTARYKGTGYHGLDHIFQYPLHPSHILETRLEQGRLVARYWPDSPLLEIQLNQDARDRIRHCRGIDQSDWCFKGSVEPNHHNLHQGQMTELLRCVRHPSSRLFVPWIEQADEGYLDKAWFLYDFEVLQSS